MKTKLPIYFLGSLILTSIGCQTDQKIPTYLYIDAINVQTDPLTQGTNSAKIIDAWVYANSNLVAGVRLPATVPIIADGNTDITILSGVAENGNYTTPTIYPFYAPYARTLSLTPTKTDTLHPLVGYSTGSIFNINETFESSNSFGEDLDFDTDTHIEVVPDDTNTFGHSAKIVLSEAHPSFQAGTIGRYSIPQGKITWVELNYRCNNEFSMGIIGFRAGQPNAMAQYSQKVFFVAKDGWNKAYFALTSEMSSLQADTYQIVITANKQTTVSNPVIFLDNIKLVHF